MPSAQRLRDARRQAFGAAVRARRLEVGLSQEDLAAAAGMDRKSISRIETGTYSPSLDRLWVLADALESDLPDLVSAATRA